jgi:hypothetical protein
MGFLLVHKVRVIPFLLNGWVIKEHSAFRNTGHALESLWPALQFVRNFAFGVMVIVLIVSIRQIGSCVVIYES